MKKNRLFLFYTAIAILGQYPITTQGQTPVTAIASSIHQQENAVKVVAHRGDWRNAPENSIPAIEYAIAMGVDVVELDVRETKDGHLVLMHDTSIDRTTKAKGLVKDYTLAELQKLYLVDGVHALTSHKIPTLEEALLVAKGKIWINLDKSYPIMDQCIALAKSTQTLDQIIFKGGKTRQEFERDWGIYANQIHFMPIVNLSKPNAKEQIVDYLTHGNPFGFEIIVPEGIVDYQTILKQIKQHKKAIWFNSLWDKQNAGHGDERAVVNNDVYNWYIDNLADYIQTDRPQVLIEYLRKRQLHQ